MDLTRLGTARPPFIAAFVAVVLLGGLVALEHFDVFTAPRPSSDLTAAILAGSVVKLTNEERTDRDLDPLAASALLTRAAQMKADDMAAKSYYSHVAPDGTPPPYWVNAVGYKYQIMGENLVIDRTNSEDVVSAWMGSPTHRENLLNDDFTEIGIGVARGAYEGEETIYVVQMLAKPLGRSTALARETAPQVSTPTPAAKPIPQPVTVPTPAREPVRAPATSAPEPVSAPAPAVEPLQPVIAVGDPLAPVLESVPTSTSALTVPEVATPSDYPERALGDTDTPVLLREANEQEARAARISARERVSVFFAGVAAQVRSFFNP